MKEGEKRKGRRGGEQNGDGSKWVVGRSKGGGADDGRNVGEFGEEENARRGAEIATE